MRLVIIGHGSIGKRHHRNAVSLGVAESDIQIVDPLVLDASPLDSALASRPDAVCVCTPLDTHYEIAHQVLTQTTAAVFIEKPLCTSYNDALALVALAAGRVAQVGYCWRFHSTVVTAVQEIEKQLKRGRHATRLKLACYACRGLWPGLSSTYGDVVYEASHEIDLACHFFGADRVSVARVGPSSAWVLLSAPREQAVDLDIDCELIYVGHPSEECRTLTVAWDDCTTSRFNLAHPSSAIAPMYLEELKMFMQALELRLPHCFSSAASFSDGAKVMEMIHYAHQLTDVPHR